MLTHFEPNVLLRNERRRYAESGCTCTFSNQVEMVVEQTAALAANSVLGLRI
jgi:transposase